MDVHWVLAWCVERDKMASDNQLAGTPSNMGFEICISVNVTDNGHINF